MTSTLRGSHRLSVVRFFWNQERLILSESLAPLVGLIKGGLVISNHLAEDTKIAAVPFQYCSAAFRISLGVVLYQK